MADYDTLKDVFDGDIDTWIDKKRLDLAFKVLDAAGTTVDVAEIVVAIGTLGLAAPVDAAALVPEGKMTAALAKALLEQLVKQAKEGAAREAAEKVEREAAEASARKFGGAAPGGPAFSQILTERGGRIPNASGSAPKPHAPDVDSTEEVVRKQTSGAADEEIANKAQQDASRKLGKDIADENALEAELERLAKENKERLEREARQKQTRELPQAAEAGEIGKPQEAPIRAAVAASGRGESVLGEDFGDDGGDVRRIVDPIDGTSSFLRGTPIWATLLARERGCRGARVGVGACARSPLVGGTGGRRLRER